MLNVSDNTTSNVKPHVLLDAQYVAGTPVVSAACYTTGVRELKVTDIRRPLARTRTNDSAKVEALMESIQQHGLREPIDVLEVDGKIYGFSGAAMHAHECCMSFCTTGSVDVISGGN